MLQQTIQLVPQHLLQLDAPGTGPSPCWQELELGKWEPTKHAEVETGSPGWARRSRIAKGGDGGWSIMVTRTGIQIFGWPGEIVLTTKNGVC